MDKILYIVPHMSTGGAPQVLVKRIEVLKNTYDIYVVEYDNISDLFVVQKNKVKSLIKNENYFTLGNDKSELLSIINKINPDIIHFEEMPEVSNMDITLISKIFKPDRNYKIFCTTHSSDFDVNNTIFYPDKFIFVSQFNSFKFSKLGVPIDVVEYPTDSVYVTEEERMMYRKELGMSDDLFHIINVGLFTPRKNQSYAIEIAKKLLDDKIMLHFIGNQADNFKFYWQPLLKNIPSNCKIWGERNDTHKFYIAADLFLFTSMGFKTNKELNPLVIKEAMSYKLPQVLFPLDVYCSKYNNNPWITYLNGNLNNDVNIIKNVINDIKNNKYKHMDWVVEEKKYEEYNDIIIDNKNINKDDIQYTPIEKKRFNNKYIVKAVHLLLNGDKRNLESIKSVSPISNYGIEYIQHFNDRYTDIPPIENCYRPVDVGRIGPYGLHGSHYGVYTSHKNAVIKEFTPDVDFLMVFEGDCILNEDIDTFIKKLGNIFDSMFFNDISYTSLGSKYNLMTNELVSSEIEKLQDTNLLYITDKIIGIHSIIFSNYCRNFLFDTYNTEKWDVSDLYYNRIFKKEYKKAIVYETLATQSEDTSSIDDVKKIHYQNRDINNINSNEITFDDVITQYHVYDNKIYISLKDVYIQNIKFSIVIKDKNNIILYKSDLQFTPHEAVWFQIENITHYDRLYIDFIDINTKTHKFTKDIIINETNKKEYGDKQELDQFKIIHNENKNIKPTEKDFKIYYSKEDKRVYIKYLNEIKETFIVVLYNYVNNIKLWTDKFICQNNYYVWMYNEVNHTNTLGYYIEVFDKNEELLFTKNIIFDQNKQNIQYEIIENDKIKDEKLKQNVFHKENVQTEDDIIIISSYPDTIIKENVTISCIKQLKKLNKKILLSSHYPVSDNIQKLVDYYIYDNHNPIINHSYYKQMWKESNEYKITINFKNLNRVAKNQSLTVYNNIYNSIYFAKSLGFKRIYSFTYDFIIDDRDIKTILDIGDKIDNQKKHGYLIKFKDNDIDVIKTVFFVIDIEYYLKYFENVRTEEQYNKMCKMIESENFLEHVFYKLLKNNLDDFIINHIMENELFNNSQINIFSECEYPVVLPVKNMLNTYCMWFNSNNLVDNRYLDIKLYSNDILLYKDTILINTEITYYKLFTTHNKNNYKVIYTIYDDKNEKSIVYDIDDNIMKNGEFILYKDNNNIINKDKIVTILNYNTKYYNNIRNNIEMCKIFSDMIIIPICDYIDENTPENKNILEQTYIENNCDIVRFLEFEYHSLLDNKDQNFIFNVGTKIAYNNINDIDYEYILLVHPSYVINREDVKEFYNNNTLNINKNGDIIFMKKDQFNKNYINIK